MTRSEPVDSRIAGHALKERRSRSFDFRTPGKGSIYAYAVTWTPGTVMIAGDIGEMTITHWNALADFREGMIWLVSSHWDYLLGKADAHARRDVFDPEQTVRDILEWVESGCYPKMTERLKDHLGVPKAWGAGLVSAIKKRLPDEVSDAGQNGIGQWCWDTLQMNDYYGSFTRSEHSVFQIRAIQRAATMILAECFPYEWVR